MRTLILNLLLALVSFSLLAEPIAVQSFENNATDTWTYTASPASTIPYFWGRTNQVLGGASAQNGSWYWASWLQETTECSVTFDNIAITPGTQHSVSFYYYSKNLYPATDVFQVCIEYDTGTEWNNWHQLLLDTQTWSLFSLNLPTTASTVRMKLSTQYTHTNTNKFAHWDNLIIGPDIAQYTAPVVFNTSIVQRTDGSKIVDIHYDLFDANGDNCEIGLKLSEDGGNNFNIIPNPALLSGDVGENIAPGFGKHIVWDAGAEDMYHDGSQYVLKFTAIDSNFAVPYNFVFVEGGTVAGITVSDFYIDKYELTNSAWNAIMGSGGGDNSPHASVSWFGALEYCNRRSLQEALTPCYTYGSYGTNTDNWPSGWNSTPENSLNVSCDFSATGYRLPSEDEWGYAARGGLQTHGYTYSGSNNLNEVGWYSGNSGYPPRPVGQLAPNELGIYDMSGNIWELCWDLRSSTSSDRGLRGGSFLNEAYLCTVSYRHGISPTSSTWAVGFRVCRSVP